MKTPAAETIARRRRAVGLTQAGVAARVGTSQSAISRYEAGISVPRRSTFHRVLSACGVRRASAALADNEVELLEKLSSSGVTEAWVFGSVARGEDDAASDIDILVEATPPLSLFKMIRLEQELEELLGAPVDVGTLDSLKPRVAERVLPGLKPLFH
ncbi:MAG: nucleotidyltransferase domain-containing protein [Acidimicrobiales bacterium]